MRWNSRVGLTRKFERLLGLRSESVIRDVDIPLERAGEFLEFFARAYGGEACVALKRKYDPAGAFPTLYEKCVLRR